MKRILIILAVSFVLVVVLVKFRLILKCFFDTYINVFTGIGYAAVAVGLVFTVVQIKDAKNRARANTSYQVHKDGRELFASIDDQTRYYIMGKVPTSSKTNLWRLDRQAEDKIHELLMFYASIHHQWSFGNLDEEFYRDIYIEELRNFLAYKRVRQYWKDHFEAVEVWGWEFTKLCRELLDC
jgi:hypothetical protein